MSIHDTSRPSPGTARLIPGFSAAPRPASVVGRPQLSPAPEPPSPWPPRPVPPPGPVPRPPEIPEPGRRGLGLGVPGSVLELDLADRLLARRIILLSGPLDREPATRVAAQLMLLDADSADGVELHLGCPDGDLESALMLAQTIDLMRAPVTAIVLATLGGPAVVVAAAAQRRLAHPDSRFVLREPHARASGVSDELTAAAEQHALLIEAMISRLAAVTGRPASDVASDVRRGRILSASEAVEYGLVQEIVSPKR